MSPEEYLSEAGRIIRENFQANDPTGAMTAAKAGLLVRNCVGSAPGRFGFFRFKDVLDQLQQRGVLEVVRTSKAALGLRLSGIPPAASPHNLPFVPLRPPEPLPRLARLRNQVWLAFVSESPAGRRFLNKRTAVVVMGQTALPAPPEEWVEITPLDPAAEKAEATRFLQAEGLADQAEFKDALASAQWFREFPAALARRAPLVASKWNRGRTGRAVARAEDWLRQNNIAPQFVFEQSRQRPTVPSSTDESLKLRPVLLSAIGQMTTAELLELEIPARCLFSVLRPDLLNE